MTSLAQFRVQVSAKMGLDNSTDSADQTLMNAWANQGYAEVLSESRVNVDSANMNLTADSPDYTLSTSILAINEVYLTAAADGQLWHLSRVSAQEILDYRIGTQNVTSPPVRFYALNGATLLMVYPTPTLADTLTVYYVPRPTTLTLDVDEPNDIPSEWHKVIEYFMLFQAGQYINDKSSNNGETYQNLFFNEMKRLKRAALHRGGRRLSPAVVGRYRRPIGAPSQQDV